MFSIIFGHSEEDPLTSIFCILRTPRHPRSKPINNGLLLLGYLWEYFSW
jgi:hypothetical protein